MTIEDILLAMGARKTQSEEQIQFFIRGILDGTISRPQAAAWLAFAFSRGLSTPETLSLTQAMTHSGTVMRWPDGPTLVDKHSTGGVGDKVSLILAPLWVALGLRVPMVSGRGLGHTGGTLDKLEAIPGYRTDLTDEELAAALRDVGCFISGQTGTLAPADRILYALRNETQTVASVPLIVGSILSKKLAEGVQRLELDVKVGSGAFMKDLDAARALSKALVAVATRAGVDTRAHITAMDQPLGEAVGNAIEVEESIACLQGGGPDDLRDLTVALAGHPDAARVLASGAAYEVFERMVRNQGGDLAAPLHGAGCEEVVMEASRDGWIQTVDAFGVGRAAFLLGAGRSRAEDPVDFGVGMWVQARVGQAVSKGQPLVRLLHRNGRGLEPAQELMRDAIVIGDEPGEAMPLVVETIGDSVL